MKTSPEDVFTPRQSTVNEAMYVRRPELEKALDAALNGTMNIVIHGQSGCGKSWLYKKVLEDGNMIFLQSNLANAVRLGSVTKELDNVVNQRGQAELTGYSETKEAAISAAIASGKLDHTNEFKIGQKEPFEKCLEATRKMAGSKVAFLVLDNLEFIFEDRKLMDELASLITLLDDQRYSRYEVRLILVGLPGGIRRYFNKIPNRSSVANRLYEIPEVSRLEQSEARELVIRGFVEQLEYKFDVDERDAIVQHILWVSDRIPQRMHEYCLELANIAKDSRKVFKSFLPEVDRKWLSNSLSNIYGAIENWMNEIKTNVGRRNQLLVSLGEVTKDEFNFSDIEAILRQEFPESTKGKGLNTNQMLSSLCDGSDAILQRSPKGNGYMFSDPKFRMCIRVMLRKNANDETVERIAIDSI